MNSITKSNIIGFFHEDDEYGYMSNWYPAEFELRGFKYANVEQYMMAQKAGTFRDFNLMSVIMNEPDPAECKALGRSKMEFFNSEVWTRVSKTIVKRGVREKFRQNADLFEKLLGTGNTLLAEASPYDTKWGIGIDQSDPDFQKVSKWRGKNYMGRILMELREEFREDIKLSNGSYPGFINAITLPPIDEWQMLPGKLKRIPQYYDAVDAYSATLPTSAGEMDTFLYSYTFEEWEIAMCTNMGGGLPAIGFYEMKQDIYDIARRMAALQRK